MTYIYKGVEVPAPSGVEVVRDPKLEFKLGVHGVRRRNAQINALVLHWTAGEGGAKKCFDVLRGRKSPGAPKGLSVQFNIDFEGRLTQYCDADLVAFHAGTFNGRSVGVEIQNKGIPPASAKFPRGVYQTELKGQKRSFLMFNTNQLDTIVDWVGDMCEILKIPRKLPRIDGKVPTTTLPVNFAKTFKGVVFHYHIASKKIDPGTQLIDVLLDEGL